MHTERKGRKETKLTRDCAFAPWWTMSLMTTTAAWVFSLFSLILPQRSTKEKVLSLLRIRVYIGQTVSHVEPEAVVHTPLGLPSTIPCPMDRPQSPFLYIHLLAHEITIAIRPPSYHDHSFRLYVCSSSCSMLVMRWEKFMPTLLSSSTLHIRFLIVK